MEASSAVADGTNGQQTRTGIFSCPDRPAIDRLLAANPAWGGTPTGLPGLRRVDVVWAARNEMARTVEDVLARRSRWLFLNTVGCVAAAPEVAGWLAEELGRDSVWQREQVEQFLRLAAHYTCPLTVT